jgi:predicted RNA-binding Zn-ribbon protein involved in translation (DUF1610 family)
MKWIKTRWPFIILIILSILVVFLSIVDIIFDKSWTNFILISYAILIIFFFIMIFLRSQETYIVKTTVEEFEKTLTGGLYHFKCPSCNGIFAIKKSKSNNKKPVKMTCPDCGIIGTIPSSPASVEDEIPEKKSIGVNFRCSNCGEGVTIWAEGTELYSDVDVYSCPFCGKQKTMNRL